MATAWRKPVGPLSTSRRSIAKCLLGTLVALCGQPACLDVVGQRHQVQESLGRCVWRQLRPLEGRDVVGGRCGSSCRHLFHQ